MPFSLTGKTAIVTGGASGIGLSLSEVLAEAGAAVQILDLSSTAMDEATSKIDALGLPGSVTGHVCDVANEASVEEIFGRICQRARIDVLVCNAGVSAVGQVHETSSADMDRCYKVNICGMFHCLKAGVKRMLADG